MTERCCVIPVVGLGAGGHSQVVTEILRLDAHYDVIGLLDPAPALQGKEVQGTLVLGGDEQLAALKAQGIGHFFIGLGSTSDPAPRRRLYEFAIAQGLEPVSAVHPSAVVSPSASIGIGATILAGAIINPGARLGTNVIVNSGAIVEHDCTIGNHVHIATGARLAGAVWVGDDVHIGLGATICQVIRIGQGAVIGAGAVVIEDVPAGATVVGVPAKPISIKRAQGPASQPKQSKEGRR